eukprot:COSAG02_NODE_12805_length_1489_cov_2.190647_1_plen_83_part_10
MDATFCTFGGAAAELRRCATKAQLIARHASVEVRPLVTKKDKTRCCILLHLAKPDVTVPITSADDGLKWRFRALYPEGAASRG